MALQMVIEEFEKNIKNKYDEGMICINTFEEYIVELIKNGYISENGHPLKCMWCDSPNLRSDNFSHFNHTVCEYDIVCNDCDEIVGHWAYGSWHI